MAQNTSAVWKRLMETPHTEREYAFEIDGTWYGPEAEVEHTVQQQLYAEFGIGNAATASLTLSLFAQDIPRAATVRRFVRLKNGAETSEWLPKGVFFTNRRAVDNGYWTLEAYDAMRKADAVWTPDPSLSFPMTMPAAVDEFARIMDVAVDSRTTLNPAYTIDYPANDYTVRAVLQYIAAAHGGNWIISDAGELLLIPLRSIPDEVSYLVTEDGNPITFGGVRILV